MVTVRREGLFGGRVDRSRGSYIMRGRSWDRILLGF